MSEQGVLKLQEYATGEQIEFFDRLRSGDDPEHEEARTELVQLAGALVDIMTYGASAAAMQTALRAISDGKKLYTGDRIWAKDDEVGDSDLRMEVHGDTGKRRVLVVVAQAGEDHFRKVGAGAGFAAFDVAHWNKIDGRNDWREYDTLVIATLPYATASLDLNTYMAVHEKELDDEALNAPPDEVKLVRENRIAAQLAQAIGRIRLRTMTEQDGTCEPCDIFLRLPNWRYMVDADRILEAVKRTLPGAQVLPWERATKKLPRAPKRTGARYDDAFVTLVSEMAPGQVRYSDDIKQALSIRGRRAWYRMTKAARTPGTSLHAAMEKAGVSIREVAHGRGVALAVSRGEPAARPAGADTPIPRKEAALLARLAALRPGERARAADVQREAGIPQGSWAKLLKRPAVIEAMTRLGIGYQEANGGRAGSAFVR
jgi:hypothetical protein